MPSKGDSVNHVCGGSEGCMCMYDPDLNPNLKAAPEQHVHCCGCGASFPETTRPYPLSSGLCAKCVRELRRPNYQLAAENDRLRAEIERLRSELATAV